MSCVFGQASKFLCLCEVFERRHEMGTGVGGIPTSRGIEGSGGHSRRVAGVVSNLRAGAGERGVRGSAGECVNGGGGEGRIGAT